jgi:hypothetical protein
MESTNQIIEKKIQTYNQFVESIKPKTINTQIYNRWDAMIKFIKQFLDFFHEGNEFLIKQTEQCAEISN